MLSVLTRMIHEMDDICISSDDIAINYMPRKSQILESIGKQHHIPCIFVVVGKIQGHIEELVVFIVCFNVAEHHVLLERGHIKWHHN
jgi:hypothetical protein